VWPSSAGIRILHIPSKNDIAAAEGESITDLAAMELAS
jgi:hypothetical protein